MSDRKDHQADERERQRQAASQSSQPQRAQEQASGGGLSEDELMKIRKAAGAIGEVIEPVQRVRHERTN